MQVAGSREALALCVEFTPSIALYIWQTFSRPPAVPRPDGLMDVWLCASEMCCKKGCIGISMENSLTILPALLAVDSLQAIQADRLLYGHPSSPPDSLMLPPAEPLIRLLLLFAQLLAAVAAERSAILAPFTVATTVVESTYMLKSAITTRLEQLTAISCCTPVLLADPSPHGVASAAPDLQTKLSKTVITLRSLVLFLKLATLTFSVKADLNSGGSVQVPLLVQGLWDIILYFAGSFLDDLTVEREDGSCYMKVFTSQQEQTLCVVLCEHAAATLRQALKEPWAELPRKACLRLMAVLMMLIPATLLRSEVKRLGK